jgi:TetR/AcrR family tetracycline transcriptional repressor
VVEVLWAEVQSAVTGAVTTGAGWRDGVRSFARALRAVVRRHPNAAPLIISQRVMPEPALRTIHAQIAAAVADGTAEGPAYDLLRTITSYALGSALAEAHWGLDGTGCGSAVSDLLRPGIPGDLVGLAEIFCGRGDPMPSSTWAWP